MTIGRTAFTIIIDRLHAGCEVTCLRCEERFHLDAASLAMMVGAEVVGYCCPDCLTPTMRERLAAAERGKVAQ